MNLVDLVVSHLSPWPPPNRYTKKRSPKGYRVLMCRPSKVPVVNGMKDEISIGTSITMAVGGIYVLSGIFQPLIMSLIQQAGLADPTTQIYMLFYYLGPSLLLLTLIPHTPTAEPWPSTCAIAKAVGIAIFDVSAQAMNYTGAGLAGPTIFIIVYSSVAVWTAVFSRFLLRRYMNSAQWFAVFTVFGGLATTAADSVTLGPSVTRGTILVLIGSAFHALTYVMSEAVMTKGDDLLTARQTSAIQSFTAFSCLGVWQLVYTAPRYDELIGQPMVLKGTSSQKAFLLLGLFALANLVHSYAFFFTLKYMPGGSTSAGVMKGLMAVLVFCVTAVRFCGVVGGKEMCFSFAKLLSLVTVVVGVALFARATGRGGRYGSRGKNAGYTKLDSCDGVEFESVA